MIGGLDRATAGTVEVEGRDLGRLDERALTDYRRDRVGFVWQGTARNLVPYLNVLENVRLPSTASGVRVPAARRTPRELLEVVGLADRAKHRPGQLSGGEQQRVAVAVALSNVPKILLADEPTAELDSESAALVLDAFHSVNQEFGVTIVLVTHGLLAARRAGRQLRSRRPAPRPGPADGAARYRREGSDARRGDRRARRGGPRGRGARRRGSDPPPRRGRARR
jgi:ABC-type lipoprotein export system ATPase subunit